MVESGHFVGGWGLAHAELCYVKIKTFSPIEGEGQAMLIFYPRPADSISHLVSE